MRKLILALLPLLIGCTNAQNKGNDSANAADGQLVTFHLNAPPSKVEPLLLSELADSVSYVALETTKETLTKDGIQYGDRYYCCFESNILCFDKTGKFLHQVGQVGRGPQEYFMSNNYLKTFRVDVTNNWVYCYSTDHRTLVYDENGKYVKTLTGEFYNYPCRLVYNHLIYFGAEAAMLNPISIIDERTNKKVNIDRFSKEFVKEWNKKLMDEAQGYIKLNKGIFILKAMQPVSYQTKDTYYEWSVLEHDTVYKAHDGVVSPLCLLCPINKFEFKSMFLNDGEAVNLKNQPLILGMQVFKEKLLLYVQYYPSEDHNYWVVCNLKDGNVTYHTNYIINDLDGGPNIWASNDIYSLSVEDLKNDKDIYNSYFTEGVKAKLKDQEGKFQRLLEPLVDDANPIIRTFHWKE